VKDASDFIDKGIETLRKRKEKKKKGRSYFWV
jgi:hypothetical protein